MTKEPKVKKTKEPKVKKANTQFHLMVKFNAQVFEFDTDDLFKAFREIPKPYVLKTKVVVTATDSEGKKAEKALLGSMARALFRNDTALRVLIKRLLFK